MTGKCRSCGHIQSRPTAQCERCGCDMAYSAHFEERVRQRETGTRYLFPLEPEPAEPDTLPPLPDESSDDHVTVPPEQAAPAKPDTNPMEKRRPRATASVSTELAYGPVLTLSVELLLLMIWFFVLTIGTKLAASVIAIPNWKIGVAALVFWLYATILCQIGTGHTPGAHLSRRLQSSRHV